MATVDEMLEGSLVGGVRGTFGAENMVRRFHVVTDDVDDDPSAIIQTTEDTRTGQIVSIGSSHPFGAFGLVVIAYSEVERMTQTHWIVDAIYGPPLAINPLQPWSMDIDTSLDTYTAYLDLDGQTIGPAVYHPAPLAADYPGARLQAEKDRLAGKGFDINQTFKAPTPSGFIDLYALANGKRRATGLSRTRKVASFTLSRTIPNLAASKIAAVISMVNGINKSSFFGASIGTAKFIGLRSRTIQAEIPGQTIPGIAFAVELTFAVDWDGHNPSKEYDIYEHDDGTQGIVQDMIKNEPVKRSYRLYEKLEFNTILAWLDR